MLTNTAINKGNYIGVSNEICVPILSDVVIKEIQLECFLRKTCVPVRKVIKAQKCWTEVKNVQSKILKDRIFLTGIACQYKIFVGEDNVSFYQPIFDEFSLTSSVKGLIPGMIVKWSVKNKEYTKISSCRLVTYLNELTFDIQIIEQQTLWVKTRAL